MSISTSGPRGKGMKRSTLEFSTPLGYAECSWFHLCWVTRYWYIKTKTKKNALAYGAATCTLNKSQGSKRFDILTRVCVSEKCWYDCRERELRVGLRTTQCSALLIVYSWEQYCVCQRSDITRRGVTPEVLAVRDWPPTGCQRRLRKLQLSPEEPLGVVWVPVARGRHHQHPVIT